MEGKQIKAWVGSHEIVLCRHCGKPEYWGEFRWLSGICSCRNCYKSQWEREEREPYRWDDLDGRRPTMNEYLDQEDERRKRDAKAAYTVRSD